MLSCYCIRFNLYGIRSHWMAACQHVRLFSQLRNLWSLSISVRWRTKINSQLFHGLLRLIHLAARNSGDWTAPGAIHTSASQPSSPIYVHSHCASAYLRCEGGNGTIGSVLVQKRMNSCQVRMQMIKARVSKWKCSKCSSSTFTFSLR